LKYLEEEEEEEEEEGVECSSQLLGRCRIPRDVHLDRIYLSWNLLH